MLFFWILRWSICELKIATAGSYGSNLLSAFFDNYTSKCKCNECMINGTILWMQQTFSFSKISTLSVKSIRVSFDLLSHQFRLKNIQIYTYTWVQTILGYSALFPQQFYKQLNEMFYGALSFHKSQPILMFRISLSIWKFILFYFRRWFILRRNPFFWLLLICSISTKRNNM